MGDATGVSPPIQVLPREEEEKLRHVFDSEPCDCHLLGLPGHSISHWHAWLCPCITITSLSLPRYAGGWEEVRFLPRQEQAVQVCDGQAGGDPWLGGRSCSGACCSSASRSVCQAVLRQELQRGQQSVCMQLVPSFIIFLFYSPVPPPRRWRCGCEYHLLHCHLPAGRNRAGPGPSNTYGTSVTQR